MTARPSSFYVLRGNQRRVSGDLALLEASRRAAPESLEASILAADGLIFAGAAFCALPMRPKKQAVQAFRAHRIDFSWDLRNLITPI